MALISKNVDLNPCIRLSSFRKVAIGTWRTAGDPSVYSVMELDVEPALAYIEKVKLRTDEKITLTHFVGKACAETIRRHPQLNSILRFGNIFPRKSIDIFFQVATDQRGDDLSGTTVRNMDQKSIVEIARDMRTKVERIRSTGDIDYRQMKNTMSIIPGILSKYLLNFSSFLMYGLNIWTPLLGVPRDPFGTMMITNIGSIGLDMAFVPLVPYSKVPCLVAVGAVREVPVARGGAVAITRVVSLCVTFDHRIIDGMHASHMAKTLKSIFANPEGELAQGSVVPE